MVAITYEYGVCREIELMEKVWKTREKNDEFKFDSPYCK